MIDMEQDTLYQRFIRYVKIDTSSDPESETSPSTFKQWNLLNLLAEELRHMEGVTVEVSEFGYVTARIDSNVKEWVPAIGWIAHVDTSPETSGAGVKPAFICEYDGKDILLNEAEDLMLSPQVFPELLKYVGHPLIVTDGTTLLGADDKAGVAAIMELFHYLSHHSEFRHGTVFAAFTPDEEIGRGVDHFPFDSFKADFAFTIDGGEVGEIQYENFNAAMASITFYGNDIHPGEAKHKMINASRLAMEFDSLLPSESRPECTEGYEGFFHLLSTQGTVETAQLRYIIRDHDFNQFSAMKQACREHVETLNRKYGKRVASIEIKDQYFNMKDKILPHFSWVEQMCRAIEEVGVKPLVRPIRGGTDGALLSFKGLPCPNLFAGGHNFHGKYEYLPYRSLQKAYEVMLQFLKQNTVRGDE